MSKTPEQILLQHLETLNCYQWYEIKAPKYDQTITLDKMVEMIKLLIRNGEPFELSDPDYKMVRRFKVYDQPTLECWHNGQFISNPLKFNLPK